MKLNKEVPTTRLVRGLIHASCNGAARSATLAANLQPLYVGRMVWIGVYVVAALAFGACGGVSISNHGAGFLVGAAVGAGAVRMVHRFIRNAPR